MTAITDLRRLLADRSTCLQIPVSVQGVHDVMVYQLFAVRGLYANRLRMLMGYECYNCLIVLQYVFL